MKGQVIDRNIAGQKIEDFFEPWEVKLAKRQPKSDEKDSPTKSAIKQKLMGLI